MDATMNPIALATKPVAFSAASCEPLSSRRRGGLELNRGGDGPCNLLPVRSLVAHTIAGNEIPKDARRGENCDDF